MIRPALLAALLVATVPAAQPAWAEDRRLVEHFYNAEEVVQLQGRANVQAVIRFAENEHIENVAIGDSQSWQVTPNKRANLLFVKPLADRAATNMTVVTDKRTYLFDLVASPANRNPTYLLAFTYPEEPKDDEPQLAGAAPAPVPNALEVAAVTDPYAVIDSARLNRAWRAEGEPQLLPRTIYDDGDATFLSWPAGTPMPAILIRDLEGTEGPVNYAVRGDKIVVDGVPRQIILRSAKDVATLFNEGPVRTRAEPAETTGSQVLASTETRR
ncbi:TrbG/VirB9 family P-type conjugative transfer protein [Croceibacterium ferulae]|uniref:TrbG/VirB9 family P-type conjugative transfer protein n=1 Tax=Croceibacterium ferulae TaxID=1854641 RepID=UPI000EB160F0|nr:TrbG/VirB9 family P-type conjugative transfer protein [Croceibacterium ferulae]